MDDSVGANDTAAQAAFRTEVREFLAEHGEPRRASRPFVVEIPTSEAAAHAVFERGRHWQQTLFENGLAGLTYPTEFGGRGGEPWMDQVFRQESAAYENTIGFLHATLSMLGPTLVAHGTDAQKEHFLPRMFAAEYTFCQLFSEPGAGSDLASLACRAVLDGDELIVTGQKVWNSAAQFCNWGMLLTRTNPDVPKHKGITFVLVDMTSPGITVRPLIQPTRGAEFNEVFFDEVRVPVTNIIGEIDAGWGPARTVMSNESALIGGGHPSGAPTAFEHLLLLAERFGGKDDPRIRQQLAALYTRERLRAAMSGRIVEAVRRKEPLPMDPSLIKLFVTETKVMSGNLACEISGAAAQAGDDDATRWTQLELLNRYTISIGGGTSEVQRNNLAERALGLPKDRSFDPSTPWSEIPRS